MRKEGNFGSSLDEEFVWLHPVNDHTSDPWEEMEDYRWLGWILWKLKVNKRRLRKRDTSCTMIWLAQRTPRIAKA